MTDRGGPRPAPGGGALGLRLALAFISVALAAVALLAGLTAAFAAADVSAMVISPLGWHFPAFPRVAAGLEGGLGVRGRDRAAGGPG